MYLNPGHTTLNFQAELIVYRKADIVKDPMKSISFVPKNDIHRMGGVGHEIHRVGWVGHEIHRGVMKYTGWGVGES